MRIEAQDHHHLICEECSSEYNVPKKSCMPFLVIDWKSRSLRKGFDIEIDIVYELVCEYTSIEVFDLTKHSLFMKSYIEKQNDQGILENWSVAVWVNSRNDNKLKLKWSLGEFEAGLPTRSFVGKETPQLSVKGNKNAILGKEHRMVDLGFGIGKKPSEDEIKEIRKDLQQPLLVLLPIDSSEYGDIDEGLPIIGLGIIFPIIDSEKKFEYAARPLNTDFEEEPQKSDDTADDEN